MTPWTCHDCLTSILPLDACDIDISHDHATPKTNKLKIMCHSCQGWSYIRKNVTECSVCEKTVHTKCDRGELGCVRCCEDIIPGYRTSCIDLMGTYGAVKNMLFNPYSRDNVINLIGEKLEEDGQSSKHWDDLSEFLLSCKYSLQKNIKCAKNSELKIFSLNIRSLHKNISHFREEISTYSKYDVLSLNETNCTLSKLPNGLPDLILDDFHDPILQDPVRKSGRGGGLAIYVNKRVCSKDEIENFVPNSYNTDDGSGEFQFLKIHNCKGFNKTKVIVNTYRSPSKNVTKFNDKLESVLKSLDRHSRKHVVLTGDYNIDLLKFDTDSASQNLIEVMEKYGFSQLVSKPTRITDFSSTLIDHVYTNDLLNTISCNILTTDISDHLAILTTLSLGPENQNHRRTRKPGLKEQANVQRRFNAAADEEFKTLIAGEDWREVFTNENADLQYDKFCEIYTKHYDKAYPVKSNCPRRKYERKDPKPWILPWLEEACARRQELYHAKIVSPSLININAHKKN